MSYGGYKHWRPTSRRNRRRAKRASKRSESQGTDRVFFLVVGLFALAALFLLGAVALFSN
jgi:hypothetical protein